MLVGHKVQFGPLDLFGEFIYFILIIKKYTVNSCSYFFFLFSYEAKVLFECAGSRLHGFLFHNLSMAGRHFEQEVSQLRDIFAS